MLSKLYHHAAGILCAWLHPPIVPVDAIQKRIFEAIDLSLISKQEKIIWKTDPSCQALLRFIEEQYVIRSSASPTRRFGKKLPEITHFIESGSWLANCVEAKHHPAEVKRFMDSSHDVIELLRESAIQLDPTVFVNSCWKGDAKWIPDIIRSVETNTDPQQLHGVKRLKHQLHATNRADLTTRLGRFGEKYCTYLRDLDSIKSGYWPFADSTKALKYIDGLKQRGALIQELRIPPHYKAKFKTLQNRIERRVKSYLLISSWCTQARSVFSRLVTPLAPSKFDPQRRGALTAVVVSALTIFRSNPKP